MLPSVDLLAARIRLSSRNSPVQDHAASNLLHLLECHRPRGVFLTFGSASPNQDRFNYFLDQLAKMGYRFQYRKIDVAQAIGIPVKESILYLVATAEYTSDVIPDIFFPKAEPASIYSFLRYDKPVDPWYYQIKFGRTPIEGHGRSLLCWKNNCYMDADIVQWNPSHIPLINDGKQLRKLTHREIARMKGFPEDYRIEPAQRSWLYKQLMQSENIYIIRQIAESVRCALPDSPGEANSNLRVPILKNCLAGIWRNCPQSSRTVLFMLNAPSPLLILVWTFSSAGTTPFLLLK